MSGPLNRFGEPRPLEWYPGYWKERRAWEAAHPGKTFVPSRPPAGERRETRLPPIRCHTEQLERWRRAAREAGTSLSRWVRVVLDNAERRGTTGDLFQEMSDFEDELWGVKK